AKSSSASSASLRPRPPRRPPTPTRRSTAAEGASLPRPGVFDPSQLFFAPPSIQFAMVQISDGASTPPTGICAPHGVEKAIEQSLQAFGPVATVWHPAATAVSAFGSPLILCQR